MARPSNIIPPFQIATRQGDGVGMMYIYGIVGQEKEYWLEPEDQTEEITALSFVKAMNTLAETNDVIQIHINSLGGSVMEGEAIISAMRNCEAEIHTYNDGVAASMAAGIWLAGDKRFMGRNATMMIHAPISFVFGNAVEMRGQAEILDKFTQASAQGMAELVDMSVEEIMSEFFEDGKDHWMTYADVEKMGFLNTDATYEVANSVSAEIQQLSFPEMLTAFQSQKKKTAKKSVLQRIREFATTTEKSEKVNLQELREAVASGLITVEQIGEVQKEFSAPKQTAEEVMQETIRLAVAGAVQEVRQETEATISALKEEIQKLGDAPGAAPAQLNANGDPGTEQKTAVQQDAEMFQSWAEKGISPFRNPLQEIPA